MKVRKLLSVGLLLAVMGFATPARAATVDLALVLATDVSGSVDALDFGLIISGYVNAFNSPTLVNAIQAGTLGQIAVSLVFWSDSAAVGVGWTTISDAVSASAFATAVNAAVRPFFGGTGMVNGINFSSGLFASAPEATRQVIDIAGDGSESSACSFSQLNCVPLQGARDAFLTGGTNRAINALWIQDRNFFGGNVGDIINAIAYGSTNVIGGPGAFQSLIGGFEEFEDAILSKLEREVAPPVPEPATSALLMTAFGAVALLRRRRS